MPEEAAVTIARHAMENDPFAQRLGIEIVEIRPGYAKTRLQIEDSLLNFVKIPHGAVVFAVADQAFAAASNSRGRVAVALHVGITFLAAAGPDTALTAEAEEISCGPKVATYQIMVRDDQGNQIASFQGLAFRKKVTLQETL